MIMVCLNVFFFLETNRAWLNIPITLARYYFEL